MAYRLEKEPNGSEAIVIDGWEQGIAPNPYVGMGAMNAVNLEVDGEVSVGFPLTVSTVSGATAGQFCARSTRYFTTYAVLPPVGTGLAVSYAMLDVGGQVFQSTSLTGTWTFLSSSNSTSGSTSNDGLAYYLGYLFKTRGANIDYWDGSTWHTGWQTNLTAGVKHFMFVSNDNTLFITNGNNLYSIIPNDVATFDPSNSATYTPSPAAIASGIPRTDSAISLAEIGGGNTTQSTLLIGGAQNAIYPWDKISQSYAQPIYVAESYIANLVSANQNAFIFAGSTNGRGRIYITNGSQADLWFKIPDFITGVQEPYYIWGDAIFHRNNLMFGFAATRNGTGFASLSEIWAVELSTASNAFTSPPKVFRSISTLTPTATGVGIARTLIGSETTGAGFAYMVGWDDNAGSPVSTIANSSTLAGTGTSTITTDLMPVGTFLQKTTFNQVEVKFRTPLQSGETLTVTPVVDGVAGTALSFNPTITTNSISAVAPINFTGAQWLQFTVALTGNNSFSGCRLHEIRVR